MHFLDLILGWIPGWVWVTVTVLGGAALFYFLSPVLVPLWHITPKPIKILLGAIGAALLAFAAGRYKGAKTERDEQARRDARAIQTRTEVDHAVDNMSPKDTQSGLDRWRRD